MSSTIDSGGRLVIPKPIRDAIGLHPGTRVDVLVRDGNLVVVPQTARVHLVERRGRLVAHASDDMPPLTAEMVRDVLEATRR